MIIFSWINAPNIFFQLPNVKNYIVLGVQVASAYQAIKKLKMHHLGLYTLHDLSHSMRQLLQSVKKTNKQTNKGGMAITELLNTCSR